MSAYVVTAAAVKVRIGDPNGNGVARIIRRGGMLPGEVSEGQVKHLLARGLVQPLAEPEATGVETVEPKSVDDMKADELKAYAGEHGIDLGGAKNKAEVLAAIKAAEAQPNEGEGDGGPDSNNE